MTGERIVQAMYDRYAGKWYRTLTFVQRTTTYLANGSHLAQTWYEAAEVPGRLRIDTDSLSKGNGFLYARDSVFRISSGKLVSADKGLNDLLLLGFDVYDQPVARSVQLLRDEGFDLSRVHDASWEGKPAYVVGAVEGDSTSKQFWIERKRLLFVRMVETRPSPSGARRIEVRFNKYVPADGGWVAAQVEQRVDGKPRVLEEYSDIRANVPLDEALFDPREWMTAAHWYRP